MTAETKRLWLWLSAAALLTFVLRCLNAPQVFVAGQIRFVESDAIYHMRRVFTALAHGFQVPALDPYLNYPQGYHCQWPPLFDVFMAALAWCAGLGRPSPSTVEWVGALMPPLLAAATVPAVFCVARRLLSVPFALLAAAGIAILPFHVQISLLGRPDHHVAVVFLSALLLAAALRAVRQDEPHRVRGYAILGGFVMALTLNAWTGNVVLCAAFAAAWAVLTLQHAREPGRLAAVAAGAMFFVAADVFLALSLLVFRRGDLLRFEWHTLSLFHIASLAAFAAGLWALRFVVAGGASLAARLPRGRFVAALLLVVLLAAAGTLTLWVCAGPAAGSPWAWLERRDPIMRYVVESQPLTWHSAAENFSWMAALYPLLLAAVCWTAWTEGRRDESVVFGVWVMATGLMTLLQERFCDIFSINAAILNAAGFAAAAAGARRLFRRKGTVPDSRPRTGPTLASVAALGLAALLLIPPLRWLHSYWSSAALVTDNEVYELCDWLRAHTPPSAGYADMSAPPDYGVLAEWPWGDAIVALAQRGATADNFVGWEENRELNLAPYRFMVNDDPAAAEALLRDCHVRYVVVNEPVMSGQLARAVDVLGLPQDGFFAAERTAGGVTYALRPRALQCMALRLYLADARGLAHFKLRYESRTRLDIGGRSCGDFKIFEYEK